MSRVFFIEVCMNRLPAYFLSGTGNEISSQFKWFWISTIICTLNLCVYSNFLLATVFTDINLWNCVQEYGVYAAAFLKDWYFDLISRTSFFILWVSLCALYLPTFNIIAHMSFESDFQYLDIYLHFLGLLQLWSHMCFRTCMNLLGEVGNNLHISLDLCLTKELKLIFSFWSNNLLGLLHWVTFWPFFSKSFIFFAFMLAQYHLDLIKK